MRRSLQLVLFVALTITSTLAHAQTNWPRWRGPLQDGHYTGTDLPAEWSAESVTWKVPIKDFGQSSPIIWGERIFLTTATRDGTQRTVMAIDRNNGKTLWEHDIKPKRKPAKHHGMNSYATPSCVTDGKLVFACFGRGGLHGYTVEGKPAWSVDLGECHQDREWGFASCPVLVGDLVVQTCDADKGAYIAAFNKNTGKEAWRTPRPNHRCWSTPILIDAGERKEIVVNGHAGAAAYDPDTGKELWRVKGGSGRGTPTVTPGKGMVYVLCGLRAPMYAVRPGGSGDVTKTRVAWTAQRTTRDLPSPILVGDYLLICDHRGGVLTCYNATSGESLWKQRLGGTTVSSTPIAAGGMAYFQDQNGETFVVKPGPKFNLVARNVLVADRGETFRASLTPSDGQLFARSGKFLYCIGKRAGAQ